MIIRTRARNNASNHLQILIYLEYTFYTRDISTYVAIWRGWQRGTGPSTSLYHRYAFCAYLCGARARAHTQRRRVYNYIPSSSIPLPLSIYLIWKKGRGIERARRPLRDDTLFVSSLLLNGNGGEAIKQFASLPPSIKHIYIIHNTYIHHTSSTYLYILR